MRGGSGKPTDPGRQTRSGSGRKTAAAKAVRPTRATAKPKAKQKPPKKKTAPPALPSQQTQNATSSQASGKKQHSGKKEQQIKIKKQQAHAKVKEQHENEEKKIKQEMINNDESWQAVVIKVKNRRNAKIEPTKQGVAFGKVGKRKGKSKCVKKDVLKKMTSKSDGNLDCSSTIVEVEMITNIKQEVKQKEKTEPKSKEKVEQKLKEKTEQKVKEKTEQKVKEKAEPALKEKTEQKVKEKLEQKLKEKTEQKVKEKAEQTLKEKAEQKLKEKTEQKLKEKAEQKLKEKAEQKLKEKLEQKLKEKAEQKPKEKAEIKPKEKLEQKPKDKAEIKPKEKAEIKPKEKVEQKPKEKPIKKEKVDKPEKKKSVKEVKVKKEPKPKDVKKVVKVNNKIKEQKEPVIIEENEETTQPPPPPPVIKEEIVDDEDVSEETSEVIEQRNAKAKTSTAKPKSKPRKVAEQRITKERSSEKRKTVKPKVKLEKISPITVQDDEEEEDEDKYKPGPSKVAKTEFDKNKKIKVEKTTKQIKIKKEVISKKKVTKKPTQKPAIKVEEFPIIEKRHREASLNALAKVHCLYENESRSAMNDILDKSIIRKKVIKVEKIDPDLQSIKEEEEEVPCRTLRTAPGLRGVGRHWDQNLPSSSSSSSSSSEDEEPDKKSESDDREEVSPSNKEKEEAPKEIAVPEETKTIKRRKRSEVKMDLKDMVVTKRMASLNASAMMAATLSMEKRGRSDDRRMGNSCTSSDDSTSSAGADTSDEDVVNNDKLSLIVNQDADLTIHGLYTRSTINHHREGFYNISGMHYRISSTSHTQTEATAVSTETVIHTTDHVSVSHSESGGSVDAGTSSPGGSCKSYTPLGALSSMQPPGQSRPCGSSAFSAPYHPHPQDLHDNTHEGPVVLKPIDYSKEFVEPTRIPERIIGYYQPAGPLISHGGAPTASSTSKGGNDGTPDPPYPPHPYSYATYDYPGYYNRRYARPWASTSQMMTDYMEPTYPPPHPANYYHPYPIPPAVPPPPPPPPPVCYTTSPVRGLPYMEQPYQCPCPMQSSCPKNVHTGPLTGANKRSESAEAQTSCNSQQVTPLLPVALALPPEPTGVSPGPPSPARGSAGMPPPASPALATNARNNRWSPPEAGIIKPVTPPPPATEVISRPPPPSPPTTSIPSTATCTRRNKRVASDTLDLKQKRRKSTTVICKFSNKIKGIKKEKEDKVELKINNNTITNNNNNYKKSVEVQLRRNPTLKLSNGWTWEGEPFTAKVFIDTEDPGVMRKCYPAMRHREGDLIKPRDCILLRSGQRKNLPYVAKISAMWEDPQDGEMMVSVLWYYRPEHTEQGRTPEQPPDEIFASRHKDTNSVACIEDKCFVLTYHEYCRYRKSLLIGGRRLNTVVPPPPEGYPRADQLPPGQVSSDLIFFCRQVYDFRQKKIKNPPSKPVCRT